MLSSLPCEPIHHSSIIHWRSLHIGRVAFPVATYAYVGVEIVAVTAVEARTPHTSLRFAARHIAWITALMYVGCVITFYFDVKWSDPHLPPYHARSTPTTAAPLLGTLEESSSIVIIAALNAKQLPLANVLNGLLILAVLSAANTALYVSSRTLWGLACNLDPELRFGENKFWRWLSLLSTTTPGARVPGWALLVSSITFWWLLPFLLLAKSTSSANVSQLL
jgi:amino acid transporter